MKLSRTEQVLMARLTKGPRRLNWPSKAADRLLNRGLIGKVTVGKKPHEQRVVFLADRRP